ncbi:MAG: Biotin carboxyl carrier protein of acetyl-CoA carboxylase [Lentisphaerae bacterium ADurb.BinA184]|nr:MAG: Biotin carboxyl carrier protein of acetyl-CoA carboxylase [Lentisphaerae bacterium ADurb.BinA184]
MNIDEIGRIAKVMKDYDLSEFSLEGEDVKLLMKRGGAVPVAAAAAPLPVVVSAAGVGAAPATAPAVAVPESRPAEPAAVAETIASPLVGTFYRAPSPDARPFVKEGDRVTAETVVCIVEAMKVMNEVKAEKAGTIRKVLVQNATPVQFGQPLFELDPA